MTLSPAKWYGRAWYIIEREREREKDTNDKRRPDWDQSDWPQSQLDQLQSGSGTMDTELWAKLASLAFPSPAIVIAPRPCHGPVHIRVPKGLFSLGSRVFRV